MIEMDLLWLSRHKQGHLAFIFPSRSERRQSGGISAHEFFVDLGQLPGDDDFPVAQRFQDRGQEFGQFAAGQIEDQCAVLPFELGQRFAQRRSLGGREADE